jgi:sulfane dehydrogenase subunit SoxC
LHNHEAIYGGSVKMSDKKDDSQRRKFLKQSLTIGSSIGSLLAAKSTLAQSNDASFLAVDPWTKVQGSTFIHMGYPQSMRKM